MMYPISYIDPMIGTVGDEQQTSMHGGGKTYPGAVLPDGMVQLSPDTVTGGDNGTGYNYCQNTIEGFSFNHMSGIGWYGDLGNLQMMPIIGNTDLRSGTNEEVPFKKGTIGWRSSFSHANETAKAGYYAVLLERYGVFAEATATMHTGLLRFTYPKSDNAGIIINFSRRIAGKADFQHVERINDKRFEGYIRCTPKGGGFGRGQGHIEYTLYFVCEFSKAPKAYRFFSDEEWQETNLDSFEGEDVGLLLRFDTAENEKITAQCGISYTDLAGARANFEAERTNFTTAMRQAEQTWTNAIACIKVEGENQTDLTLFYTCLYHALLDPRTIMDVNGRFRDAGGHVYTSSHTQRTMFSGWDVYRSEFPLLTLIRPNTVNDTVCSLLQIAEQQNSSFPRWELMGIDSGCMVGDPGLLVFADAYMKGIRKYDAETAYELCLASAKAAKTRNGKPFQSLRPHTSEYRTQAYVADKLSDTLEFLLADYAMYRLAKEMGKTEDAAYFAERATRYAENYNPKTDFMGPRAADGAFLAVKNEYDGCGCVESNIFQQSWFVPYDVKGLGALFGKTRTTELLERLFSKADFSALWNENYNHSNEPCHNLTHYFNVLGAPHRTQYWTRRVQKEAYRLGAFGFCGNEDVGQLSAWYVLSAIGFAQLCPADPKFYINTPLFRSATLTLDPEYHSCTIAKTFTVHCDSDPMCTPYIQALYLNGERLNRMYLTYEEITSGGVLNFILTPNPQEIL